MIGHEKCGFKSLMDHFDIFCLCFEIKGLKENILETVWPVESSDEATCTEGKKPPNII